MALIQGSFPLARRRQLAEGFWDLWVCCPPVAQQAQAGQFVNLKAEGFFLRRPISVCEIRPQEGLIRLVFQVRGENLLPVWWTDLPAAARAAGPVLGVLCYGSFAGFFLDCVAAGERARRPVWLRWTLGGCAALAAMQLVVVGSFGAPLTARLEIPFITLAKSIGVEGAFQRVEGLVAAVWIGFVFFGAPGLSQALAALWGMVTLQAGAPGMTLAAFVGGKELLLFLVAALLCGPVQAVFPRLRSWARDGREPRPLTMVLLAVLLFFSIVQVTAGNYQAFIYTQF